MKRFNIITNLTNGVGLQREYETACTVLESAGHKVTGVDFRHDGSIPSADANIFLETVVSRMMSSAPQNLVVPNPEWWMDEYQSCLPNVTRFLCKTQHAHGLFKGLVGDKARYVGFMSRDLYQPELERKPKFLHLAGNSSLKNTEVILKAWKKLPYRLTVVSSQFYQQAAKLRHVKSYERVSDRRLLRLMNRYQFHLCPSQYEGFGHYIHEALGVGAVVITNNSPPMNELGLSPELLMSTTPGKQLRLARLHEISTDDVIDRVTRIAELSPKRIREISHDARAFFERERRAFPGRFLEAVTEACETVRPAVAPRVTRVQRVAELSAVTPCVTSTPLGTERVAAPTSRGTIAVLGNHEVNYCTESELSWTFERLGYRVLRFQENRDTTDKILNECEMERASLLLYVHTHGWETPGVLSVQQLIEKLRAKGVKTASFHLDLYWGLNQLDRRQDRVGDHPFWKTDYVFTADGGRQQEFASRGVNHVWLPAAVVERGCFRGTARPELAADVAFVGARGYHPEYPFRGELIHWLEATYGQRFKRFNGDTTGVFREERLNDLYASVKVVVGDSCFAGIPRYWSDRVPETLGRGGFLIHPAVEGLNIPGLVTYRPRDLEDLRSKIDYFLERAEERREHSDLAFAAVRQQHTYTNRIMTVLETVKL